LIKDGVCGIEDGFLDWFVKNPSCDEVETKQGFADGSSYGYNFLDYKIIIPKEEPKQENCCTPIGQIKRYVDCKGCDRKPKQEKLHRLIKEKLDENKPKQETLEEAAERLYPINSSNKSMEMLNRHQLNNSLKQEGFIKGAKSDASKEYWFEKFKQEQDKNKFSEEDMITFSYKYLEQKRDKVSRSLNPEELLKQFKNK
jgi:hypothetical protein